MNQRPAFATPRPLGSHPARLVPTGAVPGEGHVAVAPQIPGRTVGQVDAARCGDLAKSLKEGQENDSNSIKKGQGTKGSKLRDAKGVHFRDISGPIFRIQFDSPKRFKCGLSSRLDLSACRLQVEAKLRFGCGRLGPTAAGCQLQVEGGPNLSLVCAGHDEIMKNKTWKTMEKP